MKTSFRLDFDLLLNQLSGLTIETIEADPKATGVVNIRHDVDDDLLASVEMAEYEAKLGISSTYYILDTAPYFKGPIHGKLKRIVFLGHAIGWHNNFLTRCYHYGEQQAHIDTLNALLFLSNVQLMIGTASHGDPLCYEKKYLNYHLWTDNEAQMKWLPIVHPFTRYDLKHWGFEYEAYFTGQTHYISDSGGGWCQDNKSVIADFRSRLAKGDRVKLQVNIHPQYWDLK